MSANQPASGGNVGGTTGNPVVDSAMGHLHRLRYFRLQFDARRSMFYRQYLGQRDQKMFPDNLTRRSNTFVPYPHKIVEDITARVMDAFFNFDPWFECNGRAMQDNAPAESMGYVLHYMLKKANFMNEFEELVRNILIYGHAGIKVDWDWDYDVVTYKQAIPAIDPSTGQPIVDPNTGQPIVLGVKPAQKLIPKMRPKFTSVDVYDLLVDPDGGITAVLSERTLAQMKREAQTNPNLYDPSALAELERKITAQEPKDPGSVIIRMAEVWSELEDSVTLLTFGEDREAISYKDLRASYRLVQYSPWKRKVYGGEPILLRHSHNPFSHHKAPVLHTSYVKLPNEVFGLGAIETISDLTEGLNIFVNMVADNWNLGINKRFAYDINADIDHTALASFNVPGGKVGVSGKPQDVIEPLPFFTPAAQDYQIISLYKEMIEMTSGVSDFYHGGVGSAEGNRTATGINSVMQESNTRFKMFIRNLEVDILQPLLTMCASMVQQFSTDQIEIQITNAPPSIQKQAMVSPEELIGTFDFDLVAANYVTNKTVRQRTLLEFIQLLGPSPYVRELEGLKEIAKVFEIRNANRILKTEQEVQMEQAAQQKQQVEMMILQSMLDTESKARIQQSKPQPSGGGQGKGGGAPRNFTTPKSVPGAGLESDIRSFAESMGANVGGMLGTK